ncbi:hypothetical protein NQ318_010521 [Aromia moschata]|uniref:Uncharacterized protein n=1 Tax=Aromia moschata TaxID=1265417 RepID=A0AAV8YF70_9CUCU|nr:hypothetical protein NQ318_010521 [Aromia moschata]
MLPYMDLLESTFQKVHIRLKLKSTSGRKRIPVQDIPNIFTPAYLKAAVPNNTIKGFTKTGISDSNIDVFLDYDFLPAQVTDVDHTVDEDNTLILNASSSSQLKISDLKLPTTAPHKVLLDIDMNVPSTSRLESTITAEMSQASTSITSTSKMDHLENSGSLSAPNLSENQSICDKPLSSDKIKIIDIHKPNAAMFLVNLVVITPSADITRAYVSTFSSFHKRD